MSLPQMYVYAGRIFGVSRDRTFQSLTPDQKTVLVANETLMRLENAIKSIRLECDVHDRKGTLQSGILKHETAKGLAALLVLAEKLGLNSEQLYHELQSAAHLATRQP